MSTNPKLTEKEISPTLAAGLYTQKQLSQEQFKKIATFMEKTTGIKMPDSKRTMIQSRLANRLKVLHFNDYAQYIDYVFSSSDRANEEIVMMIDLLTTNLTHFFREKPHFDFMTATVLPHLAECEIKCPAIWSAGCSSGEEPYTLSIVMKEFMAAHRGVFTDYSILATDISSRILSKAVEGLYPLESVDKLPYDIKHKYFLKSKNPDKPYAKVKNEVRQKIQFDRLNLMDSSFNIRPKKNIIFCRNVLIYFDKPTQLDVIRKLVDCLEVGGFLFLGHSETIFGSDLPLKTVSTTVFQKIKES